MAAQDNSERLTETGGLIFGNSYGIRMLPIKPGDITTIEDEGSVDEARHAWEEMKQEVAAQGHV